MALDCVTADRMSADWTEAFDVRYHRDISLSGMAYVVEGVEAEIVVPEEITAHRYLTKSGRGWR
jgi:hypothetical protein